jgi:dephospho-CoA kinase
MTDHNPLKVGITGGIGSGKSTVAKIFTLLGVPVYYADDRAKWLMVNDPILVSNIKSAFGNEAYMEEGGLNREWLAAFVFSDADRVATINTLVHPAVKADFEVWAKAQNYGYVLKEAALIFESGSYRELDKIINVSAPLINRIHRVLVRDPHRTEGQIHAIIEKQLPDEEKNAKADYVIKNSDNKLLIPQVLQIHEGLLKLAAKE